MDCAGRHLSFVGVNACRLLNQPRAAAIPLISSRPARVSVRRASAAGSGTPGEAEVPDASENSAEIEYEEEYELEPQSSVNRRRMQAIALGLLNLLHLFAGINSIIAPFVPAEFFGVASKSLERALIRFWGSAALLRIATIISLKSAAEKNRLESSTYKRMSLGLAVSSLSAFGSVLYCINYAGVSSAHLLAFGALNLFTGIVGLWVWMFCPGVSLATLISGVVNSPRKLFASKKIGSKAFGTLAIISIGLFLYGMMRPAEAFSLLYSARPGITTNTLLRGFASTFALQAAGFVTMQDASERDRLGASTFRNINTGLAGGSILLYVLTLAAMSGKPELAAIMLAAVNTTAAVITTYYFLRFRQRKKV